MIRRIIRIDEEKCNGCGMCTRVCHEGALKMIHGKAHLEMEHYCDGLGDCLPVCPVGAISFEERDAPEYNAIAAAQSNIAKKESESTLDFGLVLPSRLSNWPVQLKLVPARSPSFCGVNLLIAADCTAYAYASFHKTFIQGRTTLIACPKLDAIDYSMKLTGIFSENDILSVTLVRMEVPCCGGLEYAVNQALEASGKQIPINVVVLSTEGKIMPQQF